MLLDKELFEKDQALYSIFHTAKIWAESASEELEPHTHSVMSKFGKGVNNAQDIIDRMSAEEIDYLRILLVDEIRYCSENDCNNLLEAHKQAYELLSAL